MRILSYILMDWESEVQSESSANLDSPSPVPVDSIHQLAHLSTGFHDVPKQLTSWGSSVQTQEPVMNISHSDYNSAI